MRDSVPSASYSSVCNVLRQWNISLIPTYRVGRLYDIMCMLPASTTLTHTYIATTTTPSTITCYECAQLMKSGLEYGTRDPATFPHLSCCRSSSSTPCSAASSSWPVLLCPRGRRDLRGPPARQGPLSSPGQTPQLCACEGDA